PSRRSPSRAATTPTAVVDADRITGRDPDAVWVRGHGMVRGLLVAAILTALAGPASSRPARPAVDPACQGTRKVDPGGSGVDVVIFKASSVAVGSNCPERPIR